MPKKPPIVAQCPSCGKPLTEDAVRSMHGRATNQKSKGAEAEDIATQAPCCGAALTYDQVRSLWGTFTASLRMTFGAGPGRDPKLRECPKGCGRKMGARAMRAHKPKCDGKPIRKRKTKAAVT